MQLVHVQPLQPQLAAYVIYPGNRKVHIILLCMRIITYPLSVQYPEHAHAVYPHSSTMARYSHIFGERGRAAAV